MASKPTDVIEDWTYGPVRWIGAGLVIGAATVGAAWSVSARRIPAPIQAPVPAIAPSPRADTPAKDATTQRTPVATPPAPEAPRAIVTELGPREVAQAAPVAVIEAKQPAPIASDGPININTAGTEQLEKLPGIGPSLAARIIEDRAKNGRFRKIQDLDRVRGIGPKLIEKMRPLIVFE